MRGRLVIGGLMLTAAAVWTVGSCKDDVGLTSVPPPPERFVAFLSGANEPTPITTAAQGLATLTITVPDSVLAFIRGGETYVNVHTKVNAGGEIRGQLFRFQ